MTEHRTALIDDECRKEFETKMQSIGWSVKKTDGIYDCRDTQGAWSGWHHCWESRKHASHAEGDCHAPQLASDELTERLETALIQALKDHGKFSNDDDNQVTISFQYGKIVHDLLSVLPHPQQREGDVERLFPIMKSDIRKVPWSVAEKAYSAYAARFGTSQSLERLAERGGFYGEEMDELFPEWREAAMPAEKAAGELSDADLKQFIRQPITDRAIFSRGDKEYTIDYGTLQEAVQIAANKLRPYLRAPSAPQVDIAAGAVAIQLEDAECFPTLNLKQEAYCKRLAEACAKAWGLTPTTGKGDEKAQKFDLDMTDSIRHDIYLRHSKWGVDKQTVNDIIDDALFWASNGKWSRQ